MKKMILFILASLAVSAQADFYHPIYISTRTISPGESCTFQLSEVDFRYATEWRYSDTSYDWMNTNVGSAKPLPETVAKNCSGSTCTVKAKHFQRNRPYYFSARQFIDENNNGTYDHGEFARDWSPAIQVGTGNDFNHRCTF